MKSIYKVTLNPRLFIADNEEETLKAKEAECTDPTVEVLVEHEHAIKMVMLTKLMEDNFEEDEIKIALVGLICHFGYGGYEEEIDEIANCVMTWVDRLEDMSLEELQQWMIEE